MQVKGGAYVDRYLEGRRCDGEKLDLGCDGKGIDAGLGFLPLINLGTLNTSGTQDDSPGQKPWPEKKGSMRSQGGDGSVEMTEDPDPYRNIVCCL